MCFLSRRSRLLPFAAAFAAFALPAAARMLRVCADPNNLPYSNRNQQGFENRIAELLARHLGAKIEYIWWAQRGNFLRDSLEAGRCDLWVGVPAGVDGAAVTRPYYTSSYVFVSRTDRALRVSSLFDERLERWRIGIHVVGNDYAPPARVLAQRGLSANLVPYSLFGRYGEKNPPARLLDAVAHGDVDVAIVWGPFAGFFAKRESTPLEILPVTPPSYLAVPFTYQISMGVRKAESKLEAELDGIIGRECAPIARILADYGIEGTACESTAQVSSASWR